MELIKEIYDRELGIQSKVGDDVRYRLRKAARALIFRGNKIAILNARSLSLHKLPGGGVEGHESIGEGLEREIREETGCKINQIREIGIVIEYRDRIEMMQVSYVFVGHVQDNSGQPVFTQKEKDEGFVLEWMDASEAVDVMKNKDKPNSYAGKFIRVRDMAILEYYLREVE
jgi:ADP-ribose pyrophosphatase YjhB (NUDIX family)